ncbi:MAG: chemotaxis protein CheB [Oceanospirillaceae bacterium]|nr:chemotaxis protein CheB [Oceanospirillaceae bacterium]MBT11231.1 chemotaxis protein CheB [Oceanospirillaceae bacterium]|tara:strand:+ start:81006 stop:82046 length:1041 start_codon:yes stop_codon:yes gene_type:complete
MALPRVGILADDRLQQHLLKSALVHFGFDVVINTDPLRFSELDAASDLDAWVVDVREDADEESLDWLDDLLDGEIPVLLGIEKAPQKQCPTFPKWEKRLYSKLRELLRVTPVVAADASALASLQDRGGPEIPLPSVFAGHDFRSQPATQVWVLGASLGGPEAVKKFLDALPGGLPVGFIYAQHIDPRFEQTLCNTIGRHSAYEAKNFAENDVLRCGEILVAPVTNEFGFGDDGRLKQKNRPWPGPYGPSIDQVILNVAEHFGGCAGYILFSGMGNDGAEAIVTLADQDIQVWAQSPETCANASMPESAIETNRINYTGDPCQLALQLVNCVKHSWIEKHEPISDQN